MRQGHDDQNGTILCVRLVVPLVECLWCHAELVELRAGRKRFCDMSCSRKYHYRHDDAYRARCIEMSRAYYDANVRGGSGTLPEGEYALTLEEIAIVREWSAT